MNRLRPTGLQHLVVALVLLFLVPSCSIRKMAMNSVADVLSEPGGEEVFSGDNDPELVADALPFAIKLYESLLNSLPSHRGLRLRTGSLYIMYANAFLQNPADMMTEAEYRAQEFLYRRAKNLYLRGRDIILVALEARNPGFRSHLREKRFGRALDPLTREDVPFLYWAAAGWLGAFAIDPFDMRLMITVPRAAAMMGRVEALNPGFRDGAVHDFYTLYYGSLPEYMGGDLEKARSHFEKAVALSRNRAAGPYLSLATTVCVKQQDRDTFKKMLNRAVEIDPDADPDNRLIAILNQRRARWLLAHVDHLFLESEVEEPHETEEKQR